MNNGLLFDLASWIIDSKMAMGVEQLLPGNPA
jgi:hypothetical protein